MKTSKFNKKTHGDSAKLKKGLKRQGWVMRHGWGSHGGTPKMGEWGWNIVFVRCFGVIYFRGLGWLGIKMHVEPPGKTWQILMGGRFWVFCFEAHVLRRMVSNWRKWASGCHWNMTCLCFSLLQGPHCLGMETYTMSPWSSRCIYDLSLK